MSPPASDKRFFRFVRSRRLADLRKNIRLEIAAGNPYDHEICGPVLSGAKPPVSKPVLSFTAGLH